MLKITVMVAGLVISTAVMGQNATREQANDALNELSSEMTECSVYFIVSSTCFRDYPQAVDMIRDYRRAADKIAQLALTAGSPIGLSVQGLAARQKLMFEDMKTSIGKSCTNLSILQERYSGFCKQLAQAPDNRLKELLSGKTCNGSYRCESRNIRESPFSPAVSTHIPGNPPWATNKTPCTTEGPKVLRENAEELGICHN